MSRIWTLQEDNILREKYPDLLTSDLMKFLPGRTYSSITGHANVLGIKKSDLFFSLGMGGRISNSNNIGIDTRFKINKPGWNKGKKQSDYMSPEKIERTKATRFKKGQDPHNTVPIGTERISKDGYVEIKIRHLKNGDANNKNFVSKHRMIYQEHFGPIPDNYNVEFIDGNRMNFEPSNFILRSKTENFLKNTMSDASVVKRFLGVKEPELVDRIIKDMPEVINLKRNAIKLNQKLNKKENAKSTK
jgi:hypothetical protein